MNSKGMTMLSIPMDVTNISPGDIGAMATLMANYMENMAEQLVAQGAREDVARTMQTLTMFFMSQSARSAIFAVASDDQKKAYETMEKLLMEVVNTPDHEMNIIELKDEPTTVDVKKH